MEKRRKAKKPNAFVPVNLPTAFPRYVLCSASSRRRPVRAGTRQQNRAIRRLALAMKPLQLAQKDQDAMEDEDGTPPARDYEIDSPQAEEWFQRCGKQAEHGFPWIDALVR